MMLVPTPSADAGRKDEGGGADAAARDSDAPAATRVMRLRRVGATKTAVAAYSSLARCLLVALPPRRESLLPAYKNPFLGNAQRSQFALSKNYPPSICYIRAHVTDNAFLPAPRNPSLPPSLRKFVSLV